MNNRPWPGTLYAAAMAYQRQQRRDPLPASGSQALLHGLRLRQSHDLPPERALHWLMRGLRQRVLGGDGRWIQIPKLAGVASAGQEVQPQPQPPPQPQPEPEPPKPPPFDPKRYEHINAPSVGQMGEYLENYRQSNPEGYAALRGGQHYNDRFSDIWADAESASRPFMYANAAANSLGGNTPEENFRFFFRANNLAQMMNPAAVVLPSADPRSFTKPTSLPLWYSPIYMGETDVDTLRHELGHVRTPWLTGFLSGWARHPFRYRDELLGNLSDNAYTSNMDTALRYAEAGGFADYARQNDVDPAHIPQLTEMWADQYLPWYYQPVADDEAMASTLGLALPGGMEPAGKTSFVADPLTLGEVIGILTGKTRYHINFSDLPEGGGKFDIPDIPYWRQPNPLQLASEMHYDNQRGLYEPSLPVYEEPEQYKTGLDFLARAAGMDSADMLSLAKEIYNNPGAEAWDSMVKLFPGPKDIPYTPGYNPNMSGRVSYDMPGHVYRRLLRELAGRN